MTQEEEEQLMWSVGLKGRSTWAECEMVGYVKVDGKKYCISADVVASVAYTIRSARMYNIDFERISFEPVNQVEIE